MYAYKNSEPQGLEEKQKHALSKTDRSRPLARWALAAEAKRVGRAELG